MAKRMISRMNVSWRKLAVLAMLASLLGALSVPQPVLAQGPELSSNLNWFSLPETESGQAWFTTFVMQKAPTTLEILPTETAHPSGSARMVGFALWVSVEVSDSLEDISPTGSVTVQSGADSCTAALNASGSGRCALFFTTPGSKTITASYAGDSNFLASPNASRNETVAALSISPTLSAGRNHTCYLDGSGALTCWGLSGNFPTAENLGSQRFTAVSAGGYHTCALRVDGTAACWSDDPQVRDGVSQRLIALSAGMDYVCGIDENKMVRCWGQTPTEIPPSVSTQTFRSISAGNKHTCAIRESDSRLACWGSQDEPWTVPNIIAQQVSLGYAHGCAILSDGSLRCWGALAAQPPVGTNYRQVGSGSSYACAQKSDGRFDCWGSNAPPVDGTEAYTAFSAGFLHTCALSPKAGGGDQLACWGQNTFSQAPRITIQPEQFTAYLSIGKSWSQALTPAGGTPNYTIALSSGALPGGLLLSGDTISGIPTALGNYNFALHISENFAASTLPLELKPLGQSYSITVEDASVSTIITSVSTDVPAGSPVLVKVNVTRSGNPALLGNVKISGSDPGVACQVKPAADGSAECSIYFATPGTKMVTAVYDGDAYYQDSDPVTREITIQPVTIAPALSAGNAFTCSIDATGTPACWGKNDAGQISPKTQMIYNRISAGDATTCARGLDSQIYCWGWNGYGLSQPPAVQGFETVTIGSTHACALQWDGSVICWGNNGADGRATPPAGLVAVAISAGNEHTCALDAVGQPVCWGQNLNGQASPPDINVAGAFSALSAGGTFTCGLHMDGQLECWGGNNAVGDVRSVPAGSYKALDAGTSHACAIGLDNRVTCWGDPSGSKTAAPEHAFQAISAGRDHTCGIRADGKLACWGGNVYGQAPVITIQPASLPLIDVDAPWERAFLPAGGRVSTYSFSIASGALPDGLGLDSNSGLISGTPARAGFYNFTVRVAERDAALPVVAEQSYALTVRAKTAFSLQAEPPVPMVGKPVHLTVTVAESPAFNLNRTPTGKVTVQSSGGPGCEITLADGQGSCILYYTAEGNSSLTATYSGDTLFLAGDNTAAPLRLEIAAFQQSPQILSGSDRTYIHKANGRLACLGQNCAQFDLNTVYSAAGAGDQFACRLNASGQITCQRPTGTTELHAGPYTGLSVGRAHACAMRVDGTIECWGDNTQGQAAPPVGTFNAVSSGGDHTCAIRSDGTLTCWGADQGSLPAGAFRELSAGARHTCALRDDGTLACFGADDAGQSTPPSGVFQAVSAGSDFTCALNEQGQVSCWGKNDTGQATDPTGTFIALGAYADHACALRPDFKLTCWGKDDSGEAPQLRVTPIGESEIAAKRYWAHHFNPQGGLKAYHAVVSSGTLPGGMGINLSQAGIYLYGTPRMPGDYDFGITWEDSYIYGLAINRSETIQLALEQRYHLRVTGADLSVAVLPQIPTRVLSGMPVDFAFNIRNSTALSAPDVLVTVTLPAGLADVRYTGLPGCQLVGPYLECAIGALDSGAERTLTVSGQVVEKNGSMLTISAQVQSRPDSWPDIDEQNNSASVSVPVALETPIFTDDFDETTRKPEWSSGPLATSPSGVTYLGDFSGSDELRLILSGIAPHKKVQVSLDLYVIGPWNGSSGTPGTWTFGETDGPDLLVTTFSNDPAHTQAFPDGYPGSAVPARTGAAGTDELGLPGLTDTRYHLTFRFDHTASDLDLTLRSLGLPEGARWGIDFVEVKIDAGWSNLYLPMLIK